MPANRQARVLVVCPHCGHQQMEPAAAISTVCGQCQEYLRVQELLHPEAVPQEVLRPQRLLNCFECGTALEVALNAQSTMCKRCSAYVDLHDYSISNAISRNFKTKGGFVINPRGYVFNTESRVGNAVIKGKLLGKLVVEHTLTIYSTAEIKGSFSAGCLIIPAANHFTWPEPIKAGSAEIAGELAADLRSPGVVILKPTARLFGDVTARNLVVETGAVVVGRLSIGRAA